VRSLESSSDEIFASNLYGRLTNTFSKILLSGKSSRNSQILLTTAKSLSKIFFDGLGLFHSQHLKFSYEIENLHLSSSFIPLKRLLESVPCFFSCFTCHNSSEYNIRKNRVNTGLGLRSSYCFIIVISDLSYS